MEQSETLARRAFPVASRYGLAVSSVAVALLLVLLPPTDLLFSPVFFLAIMVSAWFGGIGPGLLAALLSTSAIDYFFLPPFYSLRFDLAHVLGLSISRTIVEAHGEKLWATPNEDKGATIQFIVPAGSGSD